MYILVVKLDNFVQLFLGYYPPTFNDNIKSNANDIAQAKSNGLDDVYKSANAVQINFALNNNTSGNNHCFQRIKYNSTE